MAVLKSIGKLIKGIYLAVAPTLVDKQEHPLRLDSAGRLMITGVTAGGTFSEPTFTPVAGYQQLTVTNGAVVSLTPPVGATYAIMRAESADARWRDDGTNPTTASGQPMLADEQFFYAGSLSAFRIIAQTATNVTLNVSYYS